MVKPTFFDDELSDCSGGSQSPQAEASDFSPACQKFAWSKLSANLSGFAKQARGCLLNLHGEDVCVYIYYVGVSEKGVYP